MRFIDLSYSKKIRLFGSHLDSATTAGCKNECGNLNRTMSNDLSEHFISRVYINTLYNMNEVGSLSKWFLGL